MASNSPLFFFSCCHRCTRAERLSSLLKRVLCVMPDAGNHLLQMTEDDFQSKYPVHGREFYEAFQQLLRHIHEQQHGASPASIPESSADLIGLQSTSRWLLVVVCFALAFQLSCLSYVTECSWNFVQLDVASGLHQNGQQNNAWSGMSNEMLHHHHIHQQQLGFDRHSIDSSPYYYGHHHSGHAHTDAIGYGNPVEYQNQGETYEPYLGILVNVMKRNEFSFKRAFK